MDRAEVLIEALQKQQADRICDEVQLVRLKKTEDALRASEQKYRLLADNAADMIWTLNRDVQFTYMSPSSSALLGYTTEEMMKKDPVEIVTGASNHILSEALEEELLTEASGTGEPSRARILELELIHKDGSRVWTETTVSFIRDPNGKPVGTMGISRDITGRKQAEETLRGSEEKYRVLIEGTSDYIFMIDDEGKVLSANRSAAVLIGNRSKEIEGKYVSELFPKETAEDYLTDLQEVIRTGKPRSTISKLVVGEKEIWIDTSLNPVKVRNKVTAVIGVSKDISDRKKTEEALKESEEKLSTILQKSPIPTTVGGSDGSIVSFNDALERLIGYKASEVKDAKDWGEKLYPDKKYRDFVEKNIGQALSGRKQECQEFNVTCKDGSKKIIDFHTSFFKGGLVIQMIDVTEKREAEEALLESEERFRLMFDSSNDLITIADENGKTLWANSTWQTVFGHSPENQGNPVENIHPDDRTRVLEIWKAMGEDEFAFTNVEYRYRTASGQYLDIETTARMRTVAGRSLLYVIAHDLTQRKKAEEDIHYLKEYNENILESSPNPIMVIKGTGIEYVNRSFATTFGKNKGEYILKDMKDAIPALGLVLKTILQRTNEIRELEIDNKSFTVSSFKVKKAEEEEEEEEEERIGIILLDITEQKRAEIALKESEKKHRTLFETIIHGVVYQNSEGLITSANPAAERILGLTLDQMKGRTSMDPRWRAIHEDGSDFPGNTHPAMVTLKTGKEVTDVIMGVFNPRFDDYTWININSVPHFRDGEVRPYQVHTTFEDITERKKAKDKIEKLSKFPNENLNPVLRIGKDNVILYANDASRSLLKEWNCSIGQPVHGSLRPIVKETFDTAQARDLETKCGAIIFKLTFTPVGNEDYINIYGADVTEHKGAIAAMAESEAKMRSMLENSPDFITIVNRDHRILYINRTLIRSPEDVVGTSIYDFAQPDQRDEYLKVITEVFQTGETSKIVAEIMDAQGKTAWYENRFAPIKQGDEILFVMIISTDITARKNALEELENSLREKETLLKEVHHRVKNNMQVISSILNLQSRQSKNEEVREVLGRARNRVQSMSAIHEQLYRSGDLSRIDMAQYLRSLTNGLYRAYGVNPERIMLNLNVRDISMGIELAIPCGLIVNELVSNSLKYAFPTGWTGKGEISVELLREPSGEDRSAVTYILIAGDNGIGVTEETELRGMDSLGMRLVEILAEDQLDGNIEIERETGLCYRITFGGGE